MGLLFQNVSLIRYAKKSYELIANWNWFYLNQISLRRTIAYNIVYIISEVWRWERITINISSSTNMSTCIMIITTIISKCFFLLYHSYIRQILICKAFFAFWFLTGDRASFILTHLYCFLPTLVRSFLNTYFQLDIKHSRNEDFLY